MEALPVVPKVEVELSEEPVSRPGAQEPAKTDYTFVPVNRQAFSRDLEQAGEDVREYGEFFGSSAANVTFAFSSLLSVGGVSFVLRGGVIAAALMSAVPAWGRYDPITIVTGRKDDGEDDEGSDADAMLDFINDARSRVKKESLL